MSSPHTRSPKRTKPTKYPKKTQNAIRTSPAVRTALGVIPLALCCAGSLAPLPRRYQRAIGAAHSTTTMLRTSPIGLAAPHHRTYESNAELIAVCGALGSPARLSMNIENNPVPIRQKTKNFVPIRLSPAPNMGIGRPASASCPPSHRSLLRAKCLRKTMNVIPNIRGMIHPSHIEGMIPLRNHAPIRNIPVSRPSILVTSVRSSLAAASHAQSRRERSTSNRPTATLVSTGYVAEDRNVTWMARDSNAGRRTSRYSADTTFQRPPSPQPRATSPAIFRASSVLTRRLI